MKCRALLFWATGPEKRDRKPKTKSEVMGMAQQRIQKHKSKAKRSSAAEAEIATIASPQRSRNIIARTTSHVSAIDAVLATNRRH